jgi:hypothetical protein
MQRFSVTMQPLPRGTRLFVVAGRDDVMRAQDDTTANHPRDVAALARSVALCVAAPVSSFATRTTDDLGFGTTTMRNDVEVAFPAHRRRGRCFQGSDLFGDLRQLCVEKVTS